MNSNKHSLIIYLVIIVIMFFALHKFLYRQQGYIEHMVSYMMYPFIKFQQCITKPIKNYWSERYALQQLKQLVRTLRADKKLLLQQLIAAQSVILRMKATQELIDFKEHYLPSSACLAQIMYRNFTDSEHSILVDKGKNHGIDVDMVVVYNNCLLGRVAQVFPYYSKVILITDASCKVAALTCATKAHGIMEGCNDAAMMLNYVSHLNTVKEHDMVLSSGEGIIFPQGLSLGTIQSCSLQGMYYVIYVKPSIDIQDIEYCYVMQKGQ